jgi:hypothetical protein
VKGKYFQSITFTAPKITTTTTTEFDLTLTWASKKSYIIHSRLCVLTFSWRFVVAVIFGAANGDWLNIFALQVTFNVHCFFFIVLGLVMYSLLYPAEIMLIIFKNTRIAFFYSVQEFLTLLNAQAKNHR